MSTTPSPPSVLPVSTTHVWTRSVVLAAAVALSASACAVSIERADNAQWRATAANVEALNARPTSGLTNEPVPDGTEDFDAIYRRLAAVRVDAMASGNVELLESVSIEPGRLREAEAVAARGLYLDPTSADYSIGSVQVWRRLEPDRVALVVEEAVIGRAVLRDVWTDEVFEDDSAASDWESTSLVVLERGDDLRWRSAGVAAIHDDDVWRSTPAQMSDGKALDDLELFWFRAEDDHFCVLVASPTVVTCLAPPPPEQEERSRDLVGVASNLVPTVGGGSVALLIDKTLDRIELDGSEIQRVEMTDGYFASFIDNASEDTIVDCFAPNGRLYLHALIEGT